MAPPSIPLGLLLELLAKHGSKFVAQAYPFLAHSRPGVASLSTVPLSGSGGGGGSLPPSSASGPRTASAELLSSAEPPFVQPKPGSSFMAEPQMAEFDTPAEDLAPRKKSASIERPSQNAMRRPRLDRVNLGKGLSASKLQALRALAARLLEGANPMLGLMSPMDESGNIMGATPRGGKAY